MLVSDAKRDWGHVDYVKMQWLMLQWIVQKILLSQLEEWKL